MICPPCAEAADVASEHSFSVDHAPLICRDHAIQPHGCACQHGLTHQPAPTSRTREAQPA